MSSECPSRPVLLAFADGDLSWRETFRVRGHAIRCGTCRKTVRGLRRADVSEEEMREAWTDIERRSREYAHAAATRPEEQPWPWRWVTAAAILPVVVLAAMLRQPVVLHADAVLAQAHEAATTDAQRVRIRLRPLAWGRADIATLDVQDGRPAVVGNVHAGLAEAMRLAGLDLARPLNLDAWRAWRASAAPRTDAVSILSDGGIRLRTRLGGHASIQSAELVTAPETHRVVRVAYVIAGIGRLEASEVAYRPMTSSEVETVSALDPQHAERLEIRARVAAHYAGADLGRAVSITRAPSAIMIAGTVTADQRASLLHMLRAIPAIRTSLQVADTPRSRAPGLAEWRARVLVDSPARNAFAADLPARVSAVADRLDALQELATRYPQDRVRALPPDVRAEVQGLVASQYRAMLGDLRDSRPPLVVLQAVSSGMAIPDRVGLPPSDWRQRVSRARPHARTFSRLVLALLRRADLSDDDERGDIDRAYHALSSALSPL